MEQLNYTDASALDACADVVLAAPGKIRMFKSTFVPTSANVVADFVAAECDFTGYPALGIATTAPELPILTGSGVASASYGTYTFLSASPYTISNTVGGYWIETAGGAMVGYIRFPTPVTLGGLGQGIVCAPEQAAGEVSA